MATSSRSNLKAQDPYVVPECGCDGPECSGPDPVPWLPWKHCFKMYEFRSAAVTVDKATAEKLRMERVLVRVRYEHALCLLGRKQGPLIHSLTLLPKEQVRIYESDRYRQSTSASNRFSARTSFFTMTQRVNDAFASTKSESGGSVSSSTGVSGGVSGGVNIGILNLGGNVSASTSTTTNTHFDVARVSEQFSHVAETSSQAVESERSIVISTFEDQESLHSTARTLQNDNACQAVTYYIRRVFEVYELRTRIVGIEVQIANQWVDIGATSVELQRFVTTYLDQAAVGASHDPEVEIALPTDGLLYEAELARCCSCDCEHEARSRLELERMQLENLNLRLEAARRQNRLDAGELDPFAELPAPLVPDGA
jgi:hypothetical protein